MYNTNQKMYKIRYTLNILPIIGEHFSENGVLEKKSVKITELCFNSDELCVFDT